MSPGSGDCLFVQGLKNSLIPDPLTEPQYCQLPRCLDWSLGLSASADHRVSAMCLPSGKAAPPSEVHGTAMNRSLRSWNFFAIASRLSISVLSLAAVSSYQAMT